MESVCLMGTRHFIRCLYHPSMGFNLSPQFWKLPFQLTIGFNKPERENSVSVITPSVMKGHLCFKAGPSCPDNRGIDVAPLIVSSILSIL